MKKKVITTILMILMCIMLISNISLATETNYKTELNVVQKSSETKYLENDQGHISKTIIDSNSNTGEITIELSLSNVSKEEINNDTEVMLVIDNSPSMDYRLSDGTTRKKTVIESAKKLTEKIFSSLPSVKVGMLKFQGGTTITNATSVMCNLTDSKEQVMTSLDKLSLESTSGGTNILAGLTKARITFSQSCTNKIIILFTDGVPSYDLSGNNNSNLETIYNNTKNGLISISNQNIHIVSMMTGILGDSTDSSYANVVEKIFGTTSNPTAGSFYNISDYDISKIVDENIYSDIVNKIKRTINTVKITDYFPKEIIDNFEFSYVGTPNVGIASNNIDTETASITWNIANLKDNEVATLEYKLKIKYMQNEELLEKVIATNSKVEVSYKDNDGKDYTATLNSSPKIKLSKVAEKNESEGLDNSEKGKDEINNTIDNTTASGKLPQTGLENDIVIAIIFALIIVIISYIRFRKSKEI